MAHSRPLTRRGRTLTPLGVAAVVVLALALGVVLTLAMVRVSL